MDGPKFYIGFTKVDAAKRLVTGIAQAATLDEQGEILEYQASKRAFQQWLGNIREMHGPSAVAKSVGVVFNDAAQTISVTAYISKGAEDTWTKITEGILRGFSVGGRRIKSVMRKPSEFPAWVLQGARHIPEMIRHTTEWIMTELSLVDSPALPQAIFEMVKTSNGLEFCKRAAQSSPAVLAQLTAAAVRAFAPLQTQLADLRRSTEDMKDHAGDLELQFDDVSQRMTHLESQVPVPKPSPAKVAAPAMNRAEIRAALRQLLPSDPRRERLEIELLKS
jgi:hypothetical protein